MKAIAGLALLTVLLLSAPAASAPARDARVRPAVGIGKVDLGMTLAQVKRALGRHDTGWSERRGGARYLELSWDSGPTDYFSVGLLGLPGKLRAITISTTRPAERTSEGIGLRYRCVWRADGSGHIVQSEYQLVGTGGRVTVFVPGNYPDTSKFVAYVNVRERAAEHGLRYTSC